MTYLSPGRALFGGPLGGTQAVRFIFMDEAGTSDAPEENARVVVGIIVHADTQLRWAEAALEEALQDVPPEFRDGFSFHAEDIMNNDKYRDRWRLTDRVNLLKTVMSIPSRLNLPIAYGQTWKDSPPVAASLGLKLHEDQHWMAFTRCVAVADAWIRASADHNEIATIVAEDCDLSRYLAGIPEALRSQSFIMPHGPGMIVPREVDTRQGFNNQEGVTKVTRIRRTIHWVNKDEDNLVWIADACAYGLKRFFNGKPFGPEFCKAIHGGRLLDLDVYKRSAVSNEVIWGQQPRWNRAGTYYPYRL
jgi:hypothetical protein